MPPDAVAIYAVHAAFWATFGIARLFARTRGPDSSGASGPPPVSNQFVTAPFSRALIAFHSVAFTVMYVGIVQAVIGGHVPVSSPGQRMIGALIIAAGAALAAWALVNFSSWRFRAKLDAGHQLATGGPFRFLRHPIYMGMNLLALGTAVWMPTLMVWAGFLLMAIGSDLRARSEEPLLERTFGRAYQDYRARTCRFLPGIY